MSLYEKAYLAYKDAESSVMWAPEEYVALENAVGDLLNQLGTGDLAAVVNIAENYVGENAHLMELEELRDIRAAIERLEGVYQ